MAEQAFTSDTATEKKQPPVGNECVGGEKIATQSYDVGKPSLITTKTLKEKHHWNGNSNVWLPEGKGYAILLGYTNGVALVSEKFDSQSNGVALSMGSHVTIVGAYCLGNIMFKGRVTLVEDGVTIEAIDEKAQSPKLMYPQKGK